jgi:PAS domain S-box-containing protein
MGIDRDESLVAASAELRRRAEELLRRDRGRGTGSLIGTDEDSRLLHELQVHQIELKMQNEELRQAREEAETVLEKYTDLYDFAPVGYFTLDREGIIHTVNLTGTAVLGIERSRLIGRRFGLCVAVEAGPVFTAFLEKVFASPAREVCEVPLLKEGNSPLFVQIEGIAAASGQECRIALIDITERRRAEDTLRKSEERFRIQVECVKDYAIFMLDTQGNVLNWNAGAERLKGYRAEEIIGRHFSCFYCEEDRAGGKSAEELKKAASEGQVESVGWRVRKDGSRFWAEVIITALHDENGNLQGFSKVTHNITERLRVEDEIERLHTDLAARAAELESANIALEAFNYSVAHDLRRPLTVIHGYCEVLRELSSDRLDEQSKGYIREIRDGALRMNSLIDTLLEFSYVTRTRMRHEQVNLSALAEEVALGLKVSAPERRVAFRIAEGITANGDAGLLRVVLDNLIGNAWKFSGSQEETVIEFGITEADGKPACFVRDNGPGFDMAYADKLFIAFQRLPGTSVEGYGIGLAMVERIVRRHSGRVWAESKPGEGATFLFTLEHLK